MYELPRRSGDAHFYRLTIPLAEAVIAGRSPECSPTTTSSYADRLFQPCRQSISIMEPLRGQGGMLRLDCLTVETLGQAEDHLLLTALSGRRADVVAAEAAARLLTIPGRGEAPQRASSRSTRTNRRDAA